MKTVYVVWGETGEYSDRCEWIVAVYASKSEALRHLARLANEVIGPLKKMGWEERRAFCTKLDKASGFDAYSVPSYGIAETPLAETVEEYCETV